MRILRAVLPLFFATAVGAQERPWSIDPKPALILGDANGDQSVLFGGGLVGATRLPDGRILVADRGDFSLRVFDASGKLVKSLARKGSGPGEAIYLAKMWRCGDQVVIYDIENGYRITVFSTNLELKRSFTFRGPEGSNGPYASACNAAGTFAHLGWAGMKDMKPGVFRVRVPFWVSGVDSTVRVLGTVLGSERWGQVAAGRFVGSRPLPLGKEPVIAIGPDRIYTGSADTYSITMHDFTGRVLGTFGKPNAQLATTPADIERSIEDEAAGRGDQVRARLRRDYGEMELPKTVPAYKAMLVDSEAAVWIMDYRRGSSSMATWTVFTRDGRQIAEVQLPAHLTVTEIGRDYILGKYVDPVEDIPEIRLYKLRR